MREIFLIGNPVAGGGALARIEKASAILKGMGHSVTLLVTRKEGDAEAFARQASLSGRDTLVIAAGGDGTYNEVANGLVHTAVPMAILPLGTTSVLAREMAIPFGLEEALSIALQGRVERVHLGRIVFQGERGPLVRHFLLMAGIGFDGDAVFRVNKRIKRLAGGMAYVLSGLRTLVGYNPTPLLIHARTDGSSVTVSGYEAIIGKASCYGGNFRITPDASLFSPFFSIFITRGRRRRDLLRYVGGVLGGRHLGLPDVDYFHATELEVTGKAHIQVDGDYAGMTPVRIGVVPDSLSLVICSD